MQSEIAEIHRPELDLSLPTNSFLITEFSVLAIIAVFLIRGIWSEHCKTEKAEQELINKLVDNLCEKK